MQAGKPRPGARSLKLLLRAALVLAVLLAAEPPPVAAAAAADPERDGCRDKLRELCHGTTGKACLTCASAGAAALREAGCQNPRIEGLCSKVKVQVSAEPFRQAPLGARSGSLFSMRSSDLACKAGLGGGGGGGGGGDQSCEYAPLGPEGNLCLESTTEPTDNYFVTATSMLADANHSVFPATRMLQLRARVDHGPLNTTTTLFFSHFQNFENTTPGGNLSGYAADMSPSRKQLVAGAVATVGAWSATVAGACEVPDPDPTYSCDRELTQCLVDEWPIPGGERNHSACAAGCVRVDPCVAGFKYENITDTWRNIHNKGDGPPDPDGRGCSRGHCYGMDQIDLGANGTCSKHAAGTGVGGGKWYRFVGKDNTGMATVPPASSDHCGTAWPGWLSGWGDINTIGPPPPRYNEPGRYPEVADGVVDGTACFNGNCGVSGNTRPVPVATARCSNEQGADYLLWKLQYTSCSSSYCTDRHTIRESPCDSGDYITLDQPWRNVENERGSEPYNGQGPDGAYGADIAGLGKPTASECTSAHLYSRTNVGDQRWCV